MEGIHATQRRAVEDLPGHHRKERAPGRQRIAGGDELTAKPRAALSWDRPSRNLIWRFSNRTSCSDRECGVLFFPTLLMSIASLRQLFRFEKLDRRHFLQRS